MAIDELILIMGFLSPFLSQFWERKGVGGW
jgi:hypothetical protein